MNIVQTTTLRTTSRTSSLSISRWLIGGTTTLVLVLVASLASALTIDSGNSGLDQGAACSDTSCLPALYNLTASAPITGDVEIAGATLSFNIQLSSANFQALGGGDGAVTSIDFSNVVYSGSVTVSLDASNNYVIDLGQTAAVSGTVTPTGAGSASAIAGSMVLVTGLCSGTPGSALQCGLVFGPMVDFSADVNGNTRYFRHSVDALAAIRNPARPCYSAQG